MDTKLKIASKKETFYLPQDTGNLVPVEGRRTLIDDVECFIHFDMVTEKWVISHLESGCQIAQNESKVAAGVTAWMRVTNNPETIKTAKDICINNGFDYPINK